MERFPKSLISFQRMFPDEAACAAWLFSMRWPEGFQCPGCGHDVEREAKNHETPEEQESQTHKRSRGQSISM